MIAGYAMLVLALGALVMVWIAGRGGSDDDSGEGPGTDSAPGIGKPRDAARSGVRQHHGVIGRIDAKAHGVTR